MIGYSKEKIILESAFDKKIKHSGLKFNPALAITGVRSTGPWSFNVLVSAGVVTVNKMLWETRPAV